KADATFKIFRLGYKIITLAISDRERKIHLLEFNPSFFMSNAEAIHTVVCMKFPDISKLYCYLHFLQALVSMPTSQAAWQAFKQAQAKPSQSADFWSKLRY
ncbi:hypothetical protein HDV02_003984, partial [Globomyces sp. JEL0801]